MNARASLYFFGIPGVLMALGVRLLVPRTIEAGWPLIVSYPLFLWGPVLILLAGVVIYSYRHRSPGTSFVAQFKLKPIRGKTWLWVLGGFLVVQALELLLSPTRTILAELPMLAPPPYTPQLFDPAFEIEEGLTHLFGVPLEGNWWLIGFWLLWLVVNIGGEELLWRGWALPLQERVFGRHAWLLNGILWNVMVHAFMPWGYFTLLPISLILPYLVQRHGSTWIGIIIHGLGNLLVLAVIIPGIAG
jgi:membrane protease YdiL (CAAX protease family)